MSINVNELNQEILSEAEEILYGLGLIETLKMWGNPIVSGSYQLKLMTWRDLDIYLESDSMGTEEFFLLGKEISTKLNPSRMSFRNELIGKTPHLPKGLYWGVHTNLFNQNWKIDIWAVESEEVKQKHSGVEEIQVKLDNPKRQLILELKSHLHNHSLYRKTFFSVDIYDAVLKHGITSLEQFQQWLSSHKGIKI